eukprot:TRINITY_DN9247_c0_g1_i1.p1 TRINITY_DN9247_c0_g1~~TRINITY_DN9247_c0_g1_i1.p1  ORF type:complete len:311 (-),score=42.19 TRINITY_DN9247_c0_g1_i1:36-968(-)
MREVAVNPFPPGSFPFHVYLEGSKPYNGVFKDHTYWKQLVGLAFVMTLTSGFVNALAIFELFGYALTHLSGLTTGISVQILGKHNYALAGVFALNIGCYGTGALFSGFLVAKNKWTLGRHYAFGFFVQGCILIVATMFVTQIHEYEFYAQFLICLSCGVQNGMTSTYTNNIVRSTHITGMVNDSCMLLGYLLRTRELSTWEWWRFLVFVPIWSAFLAGGFVGIGLLEVMGRNCLWIPTGFAFFWSFVLFLLRGLSKPIQEQEEMKMLEQIKEYNDAKMASLTGDVEMKPVYNSVDSKPNYSGLHEHSDFV